MRKKAKNKKKEEKEKRNKKDKKKKKHTIVNKAPLTKVLQKRIVVGMPHTEAPRI